MMRKNYDAALEDLNKAIEFSGYKNGAYFYHREQFYSRVAGCESYALEDFNEAIQRGVESANIFGYRGAMYRDLQKPAKALADFPDRTGVVRPPGSEGARFWQR